MLLLRVTLVMVMKRKFRLLLLSITIHIFCSWTHVDPVFCKYAFSLVTSRTISGTGTPGSSFVDVNLKVVVRQATGTMMAFQPEQLHGTTISDGAVNTGMAITFSQRVGDAWKNAKKLRGKVDIASQAVENVFV